MVSDIVNEHFICYLIFWEGMVCPCDCDSLPPHDQ